VPPSRDVPAYLTAMISPSMDPAPAIADAIADAVAAYRASGDVPALLERLAAVAHGATPESLAAAVEPYRGIPEVAGPIYERIVSQRPDDARALVILANSYWLGGRGPDVVGELATRAISVDPANRGAWHLWALTEGDPRRRTDRWQQVTRRFPEDDLAHAALADNAASVASAEDDPAMLTLAVVTYEHLLARATHPHQRRALEDAIGALRRGLAR
jgi:hypothetical protein